LSEIAFDTVIAPVGAAGSGDRALYREVIADAKLAERLGFEAAWMIEHHLTDYFPTPSPLLFLSHIAAHCPRLGLGTCVLVTPWYQPMRLAEELAMLSNLTEGELHIGMGRGTARLEYDAYDVDMGQARDRFAECWRFVRQALSGQPVDMDGRFFRVRRPVSLRPAPERARLHFYGAIGSPETADIMAGLDLAPLAISSFSFAEQKAIQQRWRAARAALGRPAEGYRPVTVACFMADSDAEARRRAAEHMSRFYRLQAEHYEVDADFWRDTPGYEQTSKVFAGLKKLGDPAELGPWMDLQLIGSPATVRRQVARYAEAGFDRIVVQTAYAGVPRALRHESLRRFAREVAPEFSARFRKAA